MTIVTANEDPIEHLWIRIGSILRSHDTSPESLAEMADP